MAVKPKTKEDKMSSIGMKEMLEAGAHFGHQTQRWNPKMSRYIFGPRNGIHIIDLQQTVPLFRDAYEYMRNTTAKGGKVLFVGTKKQAQEVIKEAAVSANQFYINHRWLGGTLTNFKTIKQSIERMRKIREMAEDGTFANLPKKEVTQLSRKLEKLEKNLNGIKDMAKLPKAILIIDPKNEHLAVAEAKSLNIPIVATLDTNCDPDEVNYPIPANDDSVRSISLFVEKLAHACKEGDMLYQEELAQRKQKVQEKELEKSKDESKKAGPKVEVIAKKVPEKAAEESSFKSDTENDDESYEN